MPQPLFGIVGIDSLANASRIDVLELTAGINVQQYIRMTRPAQTEQRTQVSAWGITPITGGTVEYWPDSVNLTVAEEAVQHEEYNSTPPAGSGAGSVGFDANLIFRARATFSVSGKCTNVANPATNSWPDSFTSAIGSFSVGAALHPPVPGTNPTILSNAEYTKLRTDWHTFSYEKQWIIQGSATGVNLLDSFLAAFSIAPGTGPHVTTLTYTLAAEGFATKSAAVEFFPAA